MASNDGENKTGGRASARAQERATTNPQVKAPRAERRPEMIKQRREQRSAAYERDQRTWLYTKIGLITFGVCVVAAIGWLVFRAVEDRRLAVVPDGVSDFAYVAPSTRQSRWSTRSTHRLVGRTIQAGRTAASTACRSRVKMPFTQWSTGPSGSRTARICRKIRLTCSASVRMSR